MYKKIALYFLFLLTTILPSIGQNNTKLVGAGTSYGGSIFAINDDGTNLERWVDLSFGDYPDGQLLESNGKFWGITHRGGSNGLGMIYTLNLDGTGYTQLHAFDDIKGRWPVGTLIEYKGKIWGITKKGGISDYGVIYSLNIDGTNFSIEYTFEDLINGDSPSGLTEIKQKLWGTTQTGGTYGRGTIFSFNSVDKILTIVHEFDGIDGYFPSSQLAVINDKIWGTTTSGGSFFSRENRGFGTIYNLNLDGSGFTKIFDFNSTNGRNPSGPLVDSNGKIWGMTAGGGTLSNGVIFNMDVDGTNYNQIHDFDDINGSSPVGYLHESNGKFWGMTSQGGIDPENRGVSAGVIFILDTDGTGFTKIHDFANIADGIYPNCPLSGFIENNGKLWGTTSRGGSIGGIESGVVFNINIEDNSFTQVYAFNNPSGNMPVGRLTQSYGKLWGMTTLGGTNSHGVIYNLNIDGSGYKKVHDFLGINGCFPMDGLTEAGGMLWGMTCYGGTSDQGTLFHISSNGTEFTKVYDFDDLNGYKPRGTLFESNGKLWGTTYRGGLYDKGTIFYINIKDKSHIKVYDFDGENGKYPSGGSLVEVNDKLWGVVRGGRVNVNGVLFWINTDGTGFTIVHEFDQADNGFFPYGTLLFSNNKIWGVTRGGGAHSKGIIYTIDNTGSNFTILHDFQDDNRNNANGGLVKVNGKIWGLTKNGGPDIYPNFSSGGLGKIYSINVDGSGYTEHFALSYDKGAHPKGPLLAVVQKDYPNITWSEPKAIVYETPLNETQLNATASVSGTFTYFPESGTTLSAGENQKIYLQFVPDDTNTYSMVSGISRFITVDKADQTITINPIDDKLTFDNPINIEASSSTGLNLAYEISGPAIIEDSFIILTGKEGTVYMTVSQEGNDNYNPCFAETSFNVSKATQLITFDPIENQRFKNKSLVLIASTTSGLDVYFELVKGPAILTNRNTITFTALGTIVITATQPGGDKYMTAKPVEQSFEVYTITEIPDLIDDLSLYPNPVTNHLKLNTEDLDIISLELLKFDGSTIKEYNRTSEKLDMNDIAPGVYFLKIITTNHIFFKRVMKK